MSDLFGNPVGVPRKRGRPRTRPIKVSTWSREVRTNVCGRCGTPFTTDRPDKKFCSVKCQKGAHSEIRHLRKRAAKIGSLLVERFSAIEIFERDNWMCRDCGGPVRRDRKAGLPDSPELDHIVPLAVGGAHVRTNVQLLCKACNARKHAKIPKNIKVCAEVGYAEARRHYKRCNGPSCWAVL